VVQVVNIIFKTVKEKKMKKLITLVAAMAMVATFAMTAAAAEWDFYGSARVNTSYYDIDKAGVDYQETLNEFLQGNSRIGATVKVSDELTGGFEYGTGVNVRKLYGEWNFGPGSFLVGQTYTPLNWFYSNQIYDSDTDLLAYGGLYSGRAPMLRLTFGGFQVAAVVANHDDVVYDGKAAPLAEAVADATDATSLFDAASNLAALKASKTEIKFPTIEASYSLNMDDFGVQVAAGYNPYELTNDSTTYDVDAWVVALGANLNIGPGYIQGNVYTGDNAGHIIWIDTVTEGKAVFNGTQVLDNECWGFILVAGAKINDMFSVEFGYGQASTEVDTLNVDDEVTSYYGQTTITLAPGVFFVPEIGVVENEVAGSEVLKMTYASVKWQINF